MKKYKFQFASQRGEIFENTELISLKEAKELWRSNYNKAYYELSEGVGVQMVIWKDMKNSEDYHTKLAYIGNDYIAKNGFIYPPTAEPIKKYL